MKPRDPDYVEDVLDAARLVRRFVETMKREEFDKSILVQSAVFYQLGVMGEAIKRVSAELRDRYSDVPWANIAGLRDVLIHGYDRVEIDLAWYAASEATPRLIPRLEEILREIGQSS